MFIGSGILFTGCKSSPQKSFENILSEVTYSYYCQEDDDISFSICVGKREEPYYIDGYHNNTVDFSLLSLKDKKHELTSQSLKCVLAIDGKESEVLLSYNPIANAYMFDIGYALSGEDILIKFAQKELKLEKISENFNISWKKAIEISANYIFDKMPELKKSKLEGECYLKIIGKKDEKNIGLSWCFTYVSKDKQSYNIILSVDQEKILASDI